MFKLVRKKVEYIRQKYLDMEGLIEFKDLSRAICVGDEIFYIEDGEEKLLGLVTERIFFSLCILILEDWFKKNPSLYVKFIPQAIKLAKEYIEEPSDVNKKKFENHSYRCRNFYLNSKKKDPALLRSHEIIFLISESSSGKLVIITNMICGAITSRMGTNERLNSYKEREKLGQLIFEFFKSGKYLFLI